MTKALSLDLRERVVAAVEGRMPQLAMSQIEEKML